MVKQAESLFFSQINQQVLYVLVVMSKLLLLACLELLNALILMEGVRT